MKVEEQTITINRKEHPNEKRYPCRSTNEILSAMRKFLTTLNSKETDLLLEGNLIVDEEETAELFDSIEKNDVIGLGVVRDSGFSSNLYKVEKIHKDSDYLECKNVVTEEVEEISFEDVSIGMALGFAEILYRDEKPFGVSATYEYKIKFQYDDEDEEDTVVENTDPNKEDDSDPNENETTKEEIEPEEPKLNFKDCYFRFGFDSNHMIHYVTLTPKELWDNEKVVCDQGSTEHLADKLGLSSLEESTYEFDSNHTESSLKKLLVSFGAIENADIGK